jgi:hypothetical protein
MEIHIRYLLRNEATPRVLELSPEDYFDPLDPGETLSIRSVPRLLDPYQYTPHRADELCWTVVEVTDRESFWRVRTQLIDGKRVFMHHSQESDGSEELIHSTDLGPLCWHTIRTLKQPGKQWAVVMNSLTVERPVHFAESRNLCESRSFEELKEFGSVQ